MREILSLAVVTFTIFMIGCGNKPVANGKNLTPKEQRGKIMKYTYTRAKIEAEVSAHWREYGYRAKPEKYIALSFDDGPCDPSASGGTAAILAKLEEMNVKATFFVIGSNIRENRDIALAIYNAGHELGNHSDGYASLGDGVDKEVIASSLDAASEAIREITGKNPAFFRAPNAVNGVFLSQACLERGMSLIDGTGHYDWDGTGHTPASIRKSVLNNPKDGDIIVLHDNNTSKGDTMETLPEIIRGLRKKGFWILTVGQLAAVKEKALEAGTLYFNF